jgi:hypothetical protein
MTTYWKVTYNPKIYFLFIHYVFVFIVLLFLIFYTNLYNDINSLDSFISTIISSIFIFIIPILVLIIYPTVKIIKKKIPHCVTINTSKGEISFIYKNATEVFDKDHYEFKIHDHLNYTVFMIYRRSVATRGHYLYYDTRSIVSLPFGTSWRRKDFYEMQRTLKAIGFEEYESGKCKGFIASIMED